jgi:hypothetical protein
LAGELTLLQLVSFLELFTFAFLLFSYSFLYSYCLLSFVPFFTHADQPAVLVVQQPLGDFLINHCWHG